MSDFSVVLPATPVVDHMKLSAGKSTCVNMKRHFVVKKNVSTGLSDRLRVGELLSDFRKGIPGSVHGNYCINCVDVSIDLIM